MSSAQQPHGDAVPPPEAAARGGLQPLGRADARDHVLVVDDDPAVQQMLTEYLGAHEIRVSVAPGGAAMRQVLDSSPVDLILMDLRMPGEDGMALAREVRTRSRVPIVLLTGVDEEADRVMGLELGADDYVTKPFSPRELLARIRAVLRRSQPAPGNQQPLGPASIAHIEDEIRAYRFAGWELNLRTRRLTAPDGRKLELTNGEFSLLAAFCTAPRRVHSRDQLLGLSRLHAAEVYDRTIDVQILRLRRKLEVDPSHPTLIVTERGAGYCFTPEVTTVV